MKTIEVVAAIIRKGDRFFATQRGYGDWKDWWEFPGGKMEPGETPVQALRREIREELDTEINVDKFLTTIDWDYPAFHLTMHCYLCSLLSDSLHLNEHEAARWLKADELGTVNWLPADYQLIPLLKIYACSPIPNDRAIHFDGIENARELGGLVMQDGRTIRYGKLVRSGDLSKA